MSPAWNTGSKRGPAAPPNRSSIVAISIGVALAVIMQPGVGADLSNAVPGTVQEAVPIAERLMSIIPANPVAALAEGNVLAIIFFAILLGIGLISVGESARPVTELLDVGVAVVLRVTGWVLEVAPFGVFALIAPSFREQDLIDIGAEFERLTMARRSPADYQ